MSRSSNVTVSNTNKFGKKLTLDAMLRLFRKKVEKANVLRDLRDREFYLKPSEAKKLKSKMARRRVQKEEAKKLAREAKFSKQDK